MNNNNKLKIFDDKIVFNNEFNESIGNYINILVLKKTIVFGKNFNCNIGMIPNNVEKIFLGKNFQKSINDMPSSIKSIVFANDSIFFNSLDYLHNDLEELILGDEYNQKINKFPQGLKILVLGKNYLQKISLFPNNLKYLDIGESYQESLDNLPELLETLVLGGKFNNYIKYPKSLKYFIIKNNCLFNKQLDNLPNSLIYLSIQNNYKFPINKLTDSILCLNLGDYYCGNITIFPSKLKKIILSDNFNYNLNLNEFPQSVEQIEVSQKYKYINTLIYKFPKTKINVKS